MTDHSKRIRAAIAEIHRERAPDRPTPSLSDVISLLCHCGERLSEDCDCACGLRPEDVKDIPVIYHCHTAGSLIPRS
jgi:hypothetical protein